jgi:hypothetical protein
MATVDLMTGGWFGVDLSQRDVAIQREGCGDTEGGMWR